MEEVPEEQHSGNAEVPPTAPPENAPHEQSGGRPNILIFEDLNEVIEISDDEDYDENSEEQQDSQPLEQVDNNSTTDRGFLLVSGVSAPNENNVLEPSTSDQIEDEETADDSSQPKNLAQWVGSELVKELELELAHVKSKLGSRPTSGNGPMDHTIGDAEYLINELMEEVTKISMEIRALHVEQERLRNVSGRSARGELKARLDAAIIDNLALRKRREDVRHLLDKLLTPGEDPSAPSTPKDASELSLEEVQAEIERLKGILSIAKSSSLGHSTNPQVVAMDVDNTGPTMVDQEETAAHAEIQQQPPPDRDRELLKVQFNDLKEQLDARSRQDDHLLRRVDDLETEIARLKHELLTLTNNLNTVN